MKSSGMRVSAASQSANDKSAVSAVNEVPYSDSDITFETRNNGTQYTKTEINRMTTDELKRLAAENGMDNAYDMTGSALKQILIDMWGL